MTGWVKTAKTIYCEAVEDEVTLIGDKDGTVKCTGCNIYRNSGKNTAGAVKRKSAPLKKQLNCDGPECYRITEYHKQLFSEKAPNAG